jgi:hypothetical protein
MELTTLGALAPILRSKNAGICWITFDVMFEDIAAYNHVKESNVVTQERVAELYGRDPGDVFGPIFVDGALGFKVSILREVLCGDPDDTDVYGGQQHVPLMELAIPAFIGAGK